MSARDVSAGSSPVPPSIEEPDYSIRLALLAAIVESSDDAIVSKTLDGRILSWNAGASRIFGYTAEEVIGRPITIIIPPELHEEEQRILEQVRGGKRIEHFDTIRIAKDGRRVFISLTVSPVRDSRGVIVGASKVARDVSERKRAEQALLESERRLAMEADAPVAGAGMKILIVDDNRRGVRPSPDKTDCGGDRGVSSSIVAAASAFVRSLQAKRVAGDMTCLEPCGKLRRLAIAVRPAGAGRPDGFGHAVLDVIHATTASSRRVTFRRHGIVRLDLPYFGTGFANEALASGRPVILGASAARRNQANHDNGSASEVNLHGWCPAPKDGTP